MPLALATRQSHHWQSSLQPSPWHSNKLKIYSQWPGQYFKLKRQLTWFKNFENSWDSSSLVASPPLALAPPLLTLARSFSRCSSSALGPSKKQYHHFTVYLKIVSNMIQLIQLAKNANKLRSNGCLDVVQGEPFKVSDMAPSFLDDLPELQFSWQLIAKIEWAQRT